MATSKANERYSITLPATLTRRLDQEVGAGMTRSDVIRARLEASYQAQEPRDDRLAGRVEHLATEVRALREEMQHLVAL
jgi:metal-responsive CopG/Arc/MetJ family transcriptional regulator